MSFNDRMGALRAALQDWREQGGQGAAARLADAAAACGAIERAVTTDYLAPVMGEEWARVFAAPDEAWSVCRIARTYLENAHRAAQNANLAYGEPKMPIPAPPPWPEPTDAALWRALRDVWAGASPGMPLYQTQALTGCPLWEPPMDAAYPGEWLDAVEGARDGLDGKRRTPPRRSAGTLHPHLIIEGTPAMPYLYPDLRAALGVTDTAPIAPLIADLRVANAACAGWLVASLRTPNLGRYWGAHTRPSRDRLADLIEAPAP